MKVTLAIALLIVVGAGRTAAQPFCPGDVNISDSVTVDELVSAVNAALKGCPEPVGCPMTFNQVSGDTDCVFVGRWHPLCGGSDLEAVFSSDGTELVVSFFDPDIDLFAEVVDEGVAELYAWQLIGEPKEEPVAVDGEVLLSDPPRVALTVSPSEPPFTIDDCDFERYEGRFAEVVPALLSITSGKAASSAESISRVAAAREHVRRMRADGTLQRLQGDATLRRQRRNSGESSRKIAPAAPRRFKSSR
jgi:hypothetical protein